jgi:hypothetical protein
MRTPLTSWLLHLPVGGYVANASDLDGLRPRSLCEARTTRLRVHASRSALAREPCSRSDPNRTPAEVNSSNLLARVAVSSGGTRRAYVQSKHVLQAGGQNKQEPHRQLPPVSVLVSVATVRLSSPTLPARRLRRHHRRENSPEHRFADLESGFGATRRGFESRILRCSDAKIP